MDIMPIVFLNLCTKRKIRDRSQLLKNLFYNYFLIKYDLF